VELMTVSDRSLTEIAFAVGFQNLTTFERSFRKFFPCPPVQYRTALLEKHDLTPSTHKLLTESQYLMSENHNSGSNC
jgi:AraC-like DNA-binding protein